MFLEYTTFNRFLGKLDLDQSQHDEVKSGSGERVRRVSQFLCSRRRREGGVNGGVGTTSIVGRIALPNF